MLFTYLAYIMSGRELERTSPVATLYAHTRVYVHVDVPYGTGTGTEYRFSVRYAIPVQCIDETEYICSYWYVCCEQRRMLAINIAKACSVTEEVHQYSILAGTGTRTRVRIDILPPWRTVTRAIPTVVFKQYRASLITRQSQHQVTAVLEPQQSYMTSDL